MPRKARNAGRGAQPYSSIPSAAFRNACLQLPAALQHRFHEAAQRLRRDRVRQREPLELVEVGRGHVGV